MAGDDKAIQESTKHVEVMTKEEIGRMYLAHLFKHGRSALKLYRYDCD
jgi:hypothetical protein